MITACYDLRLTCDGIGCAAGEYGERLEIEITDRVGVERPPSSSQDGMEAVQEPARALQRCGHDTMGAGSGRGLMPRVRDLAQLIFAPRDISWYRHPNRRHHSKFHVSVRGGFAACNGMPLFEGDAMTQAEIPSSSICTRPGCWAIVKRFLDGESVADLVTGYGVDTDRASAVPTKRCTPRPSPAPKSMTFWPRSAATSRSSARSSRRRR